MNHVYGGLVEPTPHMAPLKGDVSTLLAHVCNKIKDLVSIDMYRCKHAYICVRFHCSSWSLIRQNLPGLKSQPLHLLAMSIYPQDAEIE